MPQHLTEEQLEFFSEQTRRAVSRALSSYVRGALIGFAMLVGGIGAAIYTSEHANARSQHAIVVSGRNVAVDSCNNRYRDRIVIRGLIEGSRPQIQKYVAEGTLTPQQGADALATIESELTKLPLPDCRRAAKILTDDVSKIRPNTPPPLYPGSRPVPFKYKPIG